MTSRERAVRNSEIVRARLRGLGEAAVAERFGVSPRHVRRVLAEHRETRPHLDAIDPIDVVRDALDAYDAAIEEFAVLAEETNHDSTRLGAITARLRAQTAKLELLRLAGVLPASPEFGRIIWDARQVARTILHVLDDEGVSERVQGRIVAAVEGRDLPQRPVDNGARRDAIPR